MATTPRPYLWKESQLINSSADETGATFHFYDTNAEMIYPNSGLKYKYGEIPDGHWENLQLGDEETLESTSYEFLKSDHPATGSLYMVGLHRGEHDTLYLFRYDYMRDVSELVETANLNLQVDNPIAEISANIKNVRDALFISETSLFAPSSKIELGVAYGKENITPLCIGYLDQVDWKHGARTVSFSGRNSVGFYLNDQTFDEEVKLNGNAVDVLEEIFELFGITSYFIDPLGESKNVEIKTSPNDTGLKVIQNINGLLSSTEEEGKQWDIEETYDGRIICGYDAFRASYTPRGTYEFDGKSDVFTQSIERSVDGCYSKVRCIGTDSNGKDLTPVVKDVSSWKYWNVGPHKTYHARKLEGTNDTDLEKYAEALARQLAYIGRVITYKTTLRPQLVIGDVAQVTNGVEIGDETDLGTITEIRHTYGEKGFFTEFTLSSGGDPQHLEAGAVYTTGRSLGGTNRKTRLSDFITTATETAAIETAEQTPAPKVVKYSSVNMNGAGYLSIPFNVNEDIRVRVEFELDSTAMAGSDPDIAIFGNASGTNYQSLVAVRSGYYTTSTGTTEEGFLKSTDGRHIFISNYSNHNVMDGANVTDYTPTTLVTYSMMFLGGCVGADNLFQGKIYNFQIWSNSQNKMLMHLQAADYFSADGVLTDSGLYDSIGNKFYKCDGMTVNR